MQELKVKHHECSPLDRMTEKLTLQSEAEKAIMIVEHYKTVVETNRKILVWKNINLWLILKKHFVVKKLHQQTRTLLFKNNKEDWPYLVQVIYLFLLIGFPIYSGSVIPNTTIAFDILFIAFIFYGIILLEKPNVLLLVTGIASIIVLVFKETDQEVYSEGIAYWALRSEAILPIIYFSLLGVRLLSDTLAEKVSLKLVYISISNYFTIGILFNLVFQLIHITDVGAFNFSPEIKYNYLYMSFVILSSVGLGDLLPVSIAAKSAVVMESVAGQLYLTFFVAIIIGKYLSEYSQNKTDRISR
jgi:hypothetical protein